MRIKLIATPTSLLATAALMTSASGVLAQTRDVPTEFATIEAAIAAAVDGDEIRVRNDHVDFSDSLTLSGISVTMRSYNSDFSAPASGAVWLAETSTGNNAGAALELNNATLTIEGFAQLSCFDCSMLVVGDNSTLNVENCTFQGTGQADTAPIDTGPMGQSSSPANPVSNVTVNINNSVLDQNGRGIWFRSPDGVNALNITNSEITDNSSWAVEFRGRYGEHTLNFSDSLLQTSANRTMRLYQFANTNADEVTTATINIDRVLFDLSGGARAAMIVGGVEDAAHPDSSYTLTATNCVFDLREAAANAETSAAIALPEASRRSNVTIRQSTIVTGDEVHSAVRLRGSADSAWALENSIVDGPGTALKNEGSGTVVSGVNLLNVDDVTDGSAGTTLSGLEIVGVSPEFVDRAAGDFNLASGSPAIGVGDDLGVVDDFNGDLRPNPAGSNPDLGAFESPEGDVSTSVRDWNLF